MTNTYNDYLNLIKKDPEVQIKINYMSDRYKKLP